VATDGTLNHIILRDGDGLPEHWVFSTNGVTPAAPIGVNANASEASPDFDITMTTPAFPPSALSAARAPTSSTAPGATGKRRPTCAPSRSLAATAPTC
jgi:hypothetical protein